MTTPKLHFFCGLMASGKSTLARRIAEREKAVLLVEDAWLHGLWPGELATLKDYRERSSRLKSALWPHVLDLVKQNLTVVLDFPANTRGQRERLFELTGGGETPHLLHRLDTPEAACRARLAARNAAGGHPFAPSLADFDLFARYFEPPAPGEGFSLRVWPHEPDPPGDPEG